jgi:hypothetical protein
MMFIEVFCRNREGSMKTGDLPFKTRPGVSEETGPSQVAPTIYQENWWYKVGFSKGSRHVRKQAAKKGE